MLEMLERGDESEAVTAWVRSRVASRAGEVV